MDIKVGFANINAKPRGSKASPLFARPLQRPRSLVPVDVFYERKKTGTGKQPQ